MKCYSSSMHAQPIKYFFDEFDNSTTFTMILHNFTSHSTLKFYCQNNCIKIDFDKKLTLKNINKINYVNKKLRKYNVLYIDIIIENPHPIIIDKIFNNIKVVSLTISWIKTNIDWYFAIPKTLTCNHCIVCFMDNPNDNLRYILSVLLNMNYQKIRLEDFYAAQEVEILNIINEFEHEHFYFKTDIRRHSYILEWKRKYLN